jgi:hypothetical protein
VRDGDPNVRLAGLIAIDLGAASGQTVLETVLAEPGPLGPQLPLVLELVQTRTSPRVLAALRGLVGRPDLPAAVTGRALLMLRSRTRGNGVNEPLAGDAIRRFFKAVEAGEIDVNSPPDAIALLELLEAEGPTEFALRTIGRYLVDAHPGIRAAAHRLARLQGAKAAALADSLWSRVADPKDKRSPADRLMDLTTLVAVEAEPKVENWSRLFAEGDPLLVADAVRSWRQFAGNAKMTQVLQDAAPALVKRLPDLRGDLAVVATALKIEGALAPHLDPPAPTADDAAFREAALASARTPAGDALGQRVFERAGCVKCHAAGGRSGSGRRHWPASARHKRSTT